MRKIADEVARLLMDDKTVSLDVRVTLTLIAKKLDAIEDQLNKF